MLLQKLKAFFFTSSADWWAEFRQWEQLCCPQRTTVRLVFLFLFFLLLEVGVLVITLLYIPSRMDTGSFFLNNGVPVILSIGTTGCVMSLTHMLSQRARIGGMGSTMQHFDRTLQQLDFRLRCEEVTYWTTGWSLTVLITTTLFSIAIQVFGSMVFNNLNTIILVAFINITNFPYIVFTVWFIVCELCVTYRVKLLHSLLDGEMRSMVTTRRMDKIKRPSHVLAGLTDLYAELSNAVEHISAVFGVHVMVTLGAYVTLLIFCVFSYYRAAVVLGEIETNFAWLTVSWSLYNSCYLLPKVLFGAWIRKETDRLIKLVHHHLRQAGEQIVQDQLYILSQQLEHRSLSIRTGLFTINWPVYASVIGFISTYVVILIQFDSKAMDIASKANTPIVPSP
uniref:Gustatory receptor n=1 Tax=Anopheles funestus TaxID=62324 RepID=A0A182RG09_ANOFN